MATESDTATEGATGERLLRAVESILSDDAKLEALARGFRDGARTGGGGEETVRRRAIEEAITHFSNLAAASGGASALPALVPGLGTLAAVAGGAVADVTLLLKFEVELALVLLVLHGRDLRDPRDRTSAFVLAAAGTADARSGGNSLADVAVTEGLALWNYAPRHLGKLLVTLLGKLALLSASRGLVRALPFVGIVVGAATNKVLTTRVGERIDAELRALALRQPTREDADAVPAKVRRDEGETS